MLKDQIISLSSSIRRGDFYRIGYVERYKTKKEKLQFGRVKQAKL